MSATPVATAIDAVFCSWCGRVLLAGTDTPLVLAEGVTRRISHGICRACSDEVLAEYEEEMAESKGGRR